LAMSPLFRPGVRGVSRRPTNLSRDNAWMASRMPSRPTPLWPWPPKDVEAEAGRLVDPRGARLDVLRAQGMGKAAGEAGRLQPVGRVAGVGHRMVERVGGQHDGHGAEHLVAADHGVGRRVGDDGGPEAQVVGPLGPAVVDDVAGRLSFEVGRAAQPRASSPGVVADLSHVPPSRSIPPGPPPPAGVAPSRSKCPYQCAIRRRSVASGPANLSDHLAAGGRRV
jgi:hypothetical protein